VSERDALDKADANGRARLELKIERLQARVDRRRAESED